MPLTPRQRRFVGEYLIDLDAGAAARRAGFSPKAIGYPSQLMRNPEVARAIAQAMAERAERTGITRERPSFLYVCYVMILSAIPMGVLYAFDPGHAQKIALGLQAWLTAIPDPVWQLFTVGYLGYTGGRSWEKIKGVSK
jgi:hypothetical protein